MYHMGNDSSYYGKDGGDQDKEEAEVRSLRRIERNHHKIERNV